MADTRWYTEARFGMFIHWGLYSNPGGIWKGEKTSHPYSEWLQASEQVPREEYRALMNDFNPQSFNAEEWIKEAANAGMRYFLIRIPKVYYFDKLSLINELKNKQGFLTNPCKYSGQ
ncbi:MAG: alpha-L-fucosidase [Lentisphaeria bacterium]|nr:alpha-L-fucosidase [Lentisphaeria bacterium]NQZ69335.1 alpha-L-fucosidase [Lentisphaeria bacterium]